MHFIASLDHRNELFVLRACGYVTLDAACDSVGTGLAGLPLWARRRLPIQAKLTDLRYTKGTYYADEGDFASVGSIHVSCLNTLENQITVTRIQN